MTKLLRSRTIAPAASAIALAFAAVSPAMAQVSSDEADSQSASEDESADSVIVVTGTLLRGIAPVGTNVVGISSEDVVATGAASTTELMNNIPQLGTFNTIQNPTSGFGQPIARTNLRDLGASGGSTTLVLIDGHRAVGQGILQTYVDPAVIPPSMIERVEVIPDSGSSIYGSDAIGGVINFITRDRYDGIGGSAKYGFADDYRTFDGNLSVGKDWGSGSLFASYAYAWHDNVQGIDRDYVTQDSTDRGGGDRRVTTCPLTNIVLNGTSYALPDRVPGTRNVCDSTDYADIFPSEERHSIFAGLEQEMSDRLTMNVKGYFSRRDTESHTAPIATNGTITDDNPYFSPIGAETSQSVVFDYSSVLGESTVSPARFDAWGITPTLEYELNDNWRVTALANYGRSYSRTREQSINGGAAAAALASSDPDTALNPYDLSATNPAVIATIADYTNLSIADQEIAEGRIVADGSLFTLPGGDIRLAVGYEHHYENIDARIAFGPTATPKTNAVYAGRDVDSLFGELFVPVVGPDNAMPGIQSFELTGSVRYDRYSDVGSTTNPKIGFNYEPFDGLTIRGNYGTSFHAPSLADTRGAVDERVTSIPVSSNRAPGSPDSDFFRPFLFISGGSPDLKPETADTWSLGADYQPAFLSGLRLSLTYYNINLVDMISVNPGIFTQGQAYFVDPSNAPFYILDPTLEQVQEFARGARADNFSSLEEFYATNDPYAIYDLRRYNRGQTKQDGLDFQAQINQPTGFGSVDASIAGTYTLHRKTRDVLTNPFIERLDNGFNRFRFVAYTGATAGPVSGRVTWTHSGSYPIIGDAAQERVGAYDTVDLFFAFDLESLVGMEQASFTVNVDNVFDQDPPWRNSGNGFANGSTLGRLVSLGIRAKI